MSHRNNPPKGGVLSLLKRVVATTVALALTCQEAVWGMPDQAPSENITADRTNPLTQKTQNFVIVQMLANAARLEADHSRNNTEERKKLLAFAKVLDAAALERYSPPKIPPRERRLTAPASATSLAEQPPPRGSMNGSQISAPNTRNFNRRVTR